MMGEPEQKLAMIILFGYSLWKWP